MSRESDIPEDATERKTYVLPASMVRKIEDMRFEGRYQSESAVVRELIRAGLEACKARLRQRSRRATVRNQGRDI